MKIRHFAFSCIALACATAYADDSLSNTSSVVISGYIRVGVLGYNGNANAAWGYTASPSNVSTTNVVGRANLNLNGTEDLGNGMKAIWQLNNRFSPTGNAYSENGPQTSNFANDDSYVGLQSSSWGMLRLGTATTNIADGKYDNTIWAGPDQRLGWFGGGTGKNMVRYDTPTFNNLSLSAQWSTDENKTATVPGTNRSSLAAVYDSDKWGAQVSYATLTNQTNSNATDTSKLGSTKQLHATAMIKPIDALQLAVEFQRNTLADSSTQTATALYAYYTVGKTQYGIQTGIRKDNSPALVQGNEKFTDLFVHYNFSKQTMAYVELMVDRPQDGSGNRRGTLVGLQKSF